EITKKDPDFDKVPAAYRGLLEKCLAKNAADRVGSAALLLALLEGRASVPSLPPPFPVPLPGAGEGSRSLDDAVSADGLPTMPPATGPPANPPPNLSAPGKKMGTPVLIAIAGLLLVVSVMVIYLSSQETK